MTESEGLRYIASLLQGLACGNTCVVEGFVAHEKLCR